MATGRRRLGLIVNPVAGMGGRVGLKGTDGAERLRRARQLGAVPTAAERADRALSRIESERDELIVVAAPGVMGANIAAARHFATETIGTQRRGPTTAADTRSAAAGMAERDVDLLMFAGGDGTARDISDVVGRQVALIGIPTGVKMYSGVFASTAEAAGDAAVSYLRHADPELYLRDAEVVDVADDVDAGNGARIQLHGVVRIPRQPARMLAAKSTNASTNDDAALDALCAGLARSMEPGRLYILGPGSTTGRIRHHLGLPDPLTHVDAVLDGELVGTDLNEHQLLELLNHAQSATVIASVVGGQGSLFGRGNQQISPTVLRRVGVDNIVVLAGLNKILSLTAPRLYVDTGDAATDRVLCGFRRVQVGPERSIVLEVAT